MKTFLVWLGLLLAPWVATATDTDSTRVSDAGATDSGNLAKQLANPVANLISIPFEVNYDDNVGPYPDTVGKDKAGRRYQLNIQPVIPVELNKDWNLISRTILPVIGQTDVMPGSGTQRGLGDMVQSFFLSPASPTESGLVWGAGPVLLFPTGTENLLSTRKWGAGPTGVALVTQEEWVYGMLANHLWSYAGAAGRPDVSSTLLQPFVSYLYSDVLSVTLMSESVYNWTSQEWAVPVNLSVSRVMAFGQQMVSLDAGVRYWAQSPSGGAADWGGRIGITFVFPQ